VEIPVKKPGRQKLTLVGLKGYGLKDFSLELIDDAAKAQLVESKNF
jgi:hypothetical protein